MAPGPAAIIAAGSLGSGCLALPRVEPGSYVIDVAQVLRLGPGELLRLKDWAMEVGALLVTSPSIVSVRATTGSYRLALGIGSLISEAEPPAPYHIVSSADWVDACRSGSVEPRYITVSSDARVTVKGVAVALDTADPVAMMLNGQRLEAEVPGAEPEDVSWTLVLSYEGSSRGLVGVRDGEYVLAALGGRARELLEYMLALYTSCGRPS